MTISLKRPGLDKIFDCELQLHSAMVEENELIRR
jgi:hypothetical protein